MPDPGYTTIQHHTAGQVAIIALNRPAKLNAMNNAMAAELHTAFELPSNVRALVLTGNARAFSAGWDLTEADEAETEEVVSWPTMLTRLATLPVPTIAAIEGYCLGGGLVLAMCCDLRVAGTSARLGVPEIKRGFFPGVSGSQRLTRLVGRARAKELMFFGAHIDAETAERWSLINRVVPTGEALATATRLADELAH